MLTTWIALGVITMIITGAIIKIVREKKKGVKCIGCPAAQTCAQKACTPSSKHKNRR